jgi:hypothetical protein
MHRRCPFCGAKPESYTDNSKIVRHNSKCFFPSYSVLGTQELKQWDLRPFEDSLMATVNKRESYK